MDKFDYRCRANPNTSPDSPSDGESGEMFGFALHLSVKVLGVMGDESTLARFDVIYVHFGVICVQTIGSFGFMCSKGLKKI